MKYKHSILGGTFDRLHVGHKAFIDAAEKSAEIITIGLVTDEFLGNRIQKKLIEPYNVRQQHLTNYLNSQGWLNKTSIIPLYDIYGNSLIDPNIDSIFVIDESHNNAKEINKKRLERGLRKLRIEIIPMVKAGDGKFTSSKRIRSGEINREGNLYINLFKNNLTLPDSLRSKLKEPLGEIIQIDSDFFKKLHDQTVITVGDIATQKIMNAGITPDIAIFDMKTNRHQIKDQTILSSLPLPTKTATNEPGTINNEAVKIINSALRSNNRVSLKVEGEEDLLTIPSILLSPLGTHVVYGIKNVGGIDVVVSEEKKEEIKKILEEFKNT